jgi:hypothetical protein
MEIDDLGPAERFTAGAIGEPGRRRFYIQVSSSGVDHWLLAEKEQIRVLAMEGIRTLDGNGIEFDPESVAGLITAGLEIQDPGENGERFRVGEITLAMSGELITCLIGSVDADQAISFVIAPEQFRAMAAMALQAVAAGRPICRWCRLPMIPAEHECPARN